MDEPQSVTLAGDPQLKIEREEGGSFSLAGGTGIYVPELPDALERARERMEECREAIREADERVVQATDLSHQDQDRMLEARQEYEEEVTFLSEFVSWAETVIED